MNAKRNVKPRAGPAAPKKKRKLPEVVHADRVVGYFVIQRGLPGGKPGGLYYCTDCVTYLDYMDAAESYGGPEAGPLGACATCGKPEPVYVKKPAAAA